ncbi:homeobox-leucine zipper protein HDG11 [Trifolium repens]|nr:homeobox-leucine zipper protein HDG11 [Trifolium repens]
MVSQLAILAMQELIRLVAVNEPFWINLSNIHQDGRYTLDYENYYHVFPKNNHIRVDNISEESSKYSGIVRLDGLQLVEKFLDSEKWTNLFPTIVTKAETTKVLETGSPENRDGALLLMKEEMHILSPLVRPREFNIIRYCKQVDAGVWVITDVSFDSSRPNTLPQSHSWKHPSGCMIREMPNKSCLVTWVEHVEVEDMLHTHQIFRDFVGSYILYGAESWIKELQRMRDRSFSFYAETIPAEESTGGIQTIEGRRSVMMLGDRMVKIFCECLTMTGQLEFQHLNLESSIGGVRVSLHQANNTGQPNGIVVAAATTLWLPLPAEYVFQFLKDPTKRYQWDVMACGNPMDEVGHISHGLYPGNCTSIFQPHSENYAVILQESFTSHVGSYVIYAPIDTSSMSVALEGGDSKNIQILPSGFVVCSYAHPNATFEAFNNIGSSLSKKKKTTLEVVVVVVLEE